MAIASAEAGARGIFMEKPFVQSVTEADAVVAACEQFNTKLNLALVNRYCPTIAAIWELIADGKLGTLLELRAREKDIVGGEDLGLVHFFMVHFGGAPQWCNATVTTKGKLVTPDDFIPGAEGIPMIAGDTITASFGLADGPTGFFASTVKWAQTAKFASPYSGQRVKYTSAQIYPPSILPQPLLGE